MAREMTDLRLDADGDLYIGDNGKMELVESTHQHFKSMFLSDKTEWKENPTAGVGALNFIDDDDAQSLPSELAIQAANDRATVKSITTDGKGGVTIDGYYK